jgi:hypothetical protein
MSKLILEIADGHAAIQAPDGKAMPEHMRMNTMPIFPSLILALDFLQAGSGGNAIEDILDLPGGDMLFPVAREQPAFRTASELPLQDFDNLGQQDHSARLLELGIDGQDVQVAFAEINIFCPDLGHLAHTKARSGQEEKDASRPVVFGGLQEGIELRGGEKFLGLHAG